MGTAAGTSSTNGSIRCTTTIRYWRIGKRSTTTSNRYSVYTDFLAEREYPKEQLGFVSDILTGQAQFAPRTKTESRPADRPAPFFQQALGLAGQAAGIAGNLGWNPFK